VAHPDGVELWAGAVADTPVRLTGGELPPESALRDDHVAAAWYRRRLIAVCATRSSPRWALRNRRIADGRPILRHVSELSSFQLRDGATNKMVSLLAPGQDGAATSINLEIFDVDGRQNPNSHPDSAEAFYFLSGTGAPIATEPASRSGPATSSSARGLSALQSRTRTSRLSPSRLVCRTAATTAPAGRAGPQIPKTCRIGRRPAHAVASAASERLNGSLAPHRRRPCAAGGGRPALALRAAAGARRRRILRGVTSDGMTGVVGDDATVEERCRRQARGARQLAYVELRLGSLDVVADVLRLMDTFAAALASPYPRRRRRGLGDFT